MQSVQTGKGVLLALVCLVILGVMPVIANSRPPGFDALAFAVMLSFWQTLFAAPLFLRDSSGASRGVFSGTMDRARRRRALALALATGAMFGLATWLYVLGVEKAGAANAAIAMQAYPVFAIAWETVFLKRRKTPLELALTAILILALYFLGTGGSLSPAGLSPWFIVALGVPFLWSVAHVIIREELARTPVTPGQVTFFRVAISSVFLGGLALAMDPQVILSAVGRIDFQIAAAIMGLVYYGELIVWFHAIRHIDVSLASSITTPWPALTMVLAAIVLGDAITGYQIAAFVVIAACVYGLMAAGVRSARRRAERPA